MKLVYLPRTSILYIAWIQKKNEDNSLKYINYVNKQDEDNSPKCINYIDEQDEDNSPKCINYINKQDEDNSLKYIKSKVVDLTHGVEDAKMKLQKLTYLGYETLPHITIFSWYLTHRPPFSQQFDLFFTPLKILLYQRMIARKEQKHRCKNKEHENTQKF